MSPTDLKTLLNDMAEQLSVSAETRKLKRSACWSSRATTAWSSCSGATSARSAAGVPMARTAADGGGRGRVHRDQWQEPPGRPGEGALRAQRPVEPRAAEAALAVDARPARAGAGDAPFPGRPGRHPPVPAPPDRERRAGGLGRRGRPAEREPVGHARQERRAEPREPGPRPPLPRQCAFKGPAGDRHRQAGRGVRRARTR